jgi:hypothetical protein
MFRLSLSSHKLRSCFRTDDGDMFVVKDPDLFASEVIPQYFDHNKVRNPFCNDLSPYLTRWRRKTSSRALPDNW